MQTLQEVPISPSKSTAVTSGETVTASAVESQIDPALSLSLNEFEQKKKAAEHAAREAEIETALDEFRAIKSAEVRRKMIECEEAGRTENVAWSRALDAKVAPILAVAGFTLAAIPTLLKDFVTFGKTPVAASFLIATALSLLYTVVKSVVTLSPTLKVSEPIAKFFGIIHLFNNRHIAHPASTEKPGQLYFGHVAQQEGVVESLHAAIAYHNDEAFVFRDTVTQKWNNAKVCAEKSVDIAMAVRGILLAIILMLIAGLCFELTCSN